jgi:hypothetical protein
VKEVAVEVDDSPELLLSDETMDIDSPPADSWENWFKFFKSLGVTQAQELASGVFKDRGYLAFIVSVSSGRSVVALVRPRIGTASDAIYLYGYGAGWDASEIDWVSATKAKRKADARSDRYPFLGKRYRSQHVERNLRAFFDEN